MAHFLFTPLYGLNHMSIMPNTASHLEAVRQLNLVNRFDRLPLSRYQNKLFVIIATAWLFDSVDLGGITFLLPYLREYFALDTVAAGLIPTFGFIGMFFGAFIAGMVADRIGRKIVFQLSMIIWGSAALMLALSQSVEWIYAWRFVLGFGMGMEFPIGLTLVSEFMPSKVRGRYTAILEGFWPLGFICAGIITMFVAPNFGWRWVFVIEGAPAFWLLIIRRIVPESPRWLESVKKYDKAEATMQIIEQGVKKSTNKPLATPKSGENIVIEDKKSTFKELWQGPYIRRTFVIWSLWFFCMFGYYALTSWLSSFLVEMGFTIQKSTVYTILMALGGIPGFVVAGYFVEKLGRKICLTIFIGGSAIFCFLYGNAANFNLLLTFGFMMQFFMFGMWCTLYAYTPEMYPARIRATGSGWASSIGRIGSTAGPYIVGVFLGTAGISGMFLMGAVAFVIAVVIMLIFGPETKGKTLEELSH